MIIFKGDSLFIFFPYRTKVQSSLWQVSFSSYRTGNPELKPPPTPAKSSWLSVVSDTEIWIVEITELCKHTQICISSWESGPTTIAKIPSAMKIYSCVYVYTALQFWAICISVSESLGIQDDTRLWGGGAEIHLCIPCSVADERQQLQIETGWAAERQLHPWTALIPELASNIGQVRPTGSCGREHWLLVSESLPGSSINRLSAAPSI